MKKMISVWETNIGPTLYPWIMSAKSRVYFLIIVSKLIFSVGQTISYAVKHYRKIITYVGNPPESHMETMHFPMLYPCPPILPISMEIASGPHVYVPAG